MQSLIAYIFLFVIGSAAGRFLGRHSFSGLLNGLSCVLIFAVNGKSWKSILFAVCASILLVISITDLKTYEIPLKYNAGIGILGLIRTISDPEHFYDHVIGSFAVSGILLVLYLISRGRAVGGGDIKLTAAAGLLIGWKDILLAFMAGSVTACIIHLILMKLKGRDNTLAYGPYLSFGIFLAMIRGE